MIHYQLTEEEVVRGLLKYRPPGWRRWVLIAVAVLGVGLVIVDRLRPRADTGEPAILGYMLVSIAVVAAVLRPIAFRHAFAKVVRNNAVFTVPKEVSFDEKGIVISSSVQKSEVFWPYFKRLTEDERYYYLHADHLGNVTLLPKSAFDDASRQEFLRCSQPIPHG